jgi:hypothetical protein
MTSGITYYKSKKIGHSENMFLQNGVQDDRQYTKMAINDLLFSLKWQFWCLLLGSNSQEIH